MSKVFEEIFTFSDSRFSHWSLFSNQVRMADSQPTVAQYGVGDSLCGCLFGELDSEKKRNQLPMKMDLSDINWTDTLSQDFAAYDGVFIEMDTFGQNYQLRFQTKQQWFAWQWFSKTVYVGESQQPVFIPFTEFKSRLTLTQFNPEKVTNLEIVALDKGHKSPVRIQRLGVYRNG